MGRKNTLGKGQPPQLLSDGLKANGEVGANVRDESGSTFLGGAVRDHEIASRTEHEHWRFGALHCKPSLTEPAPARVILSMRRADAEESILTDYQPIPGRTLHDQTKLSIDLTRTCSSHFQ